MGRNYGLTNAEMEIMEYLWKKNAPATFKEISDFLNQELNKNWKKQTLNSYLSNLQRSGIIGADKSGNRYAYYPLCSKDELIHNWTKQMVAESFGSSISHLLAAFTGGKKLSPEEAEEIRKLI